MKKDHQTEPARAATTEAVMPDTVKVAMGELTETVKEGCARQQGRQHVAAWERMWGMKPLFVSTVAVVTAAPAEDRQLFVNALALS